MAKITGIGGVFLNVDADTKELLKWYRDVLELDVSEYGINFTEPNLMTLITFDRKSDDQAMLNFAVDNLIDYIAMLNEKGVELHKEIESLAFGRFARIKDIAGNVIELCELNESAYREMVQKEIEKFNKD